MILKSLQLENYRNYEFLDLELSPSIQIFFGRNAQGKTNILESIYFSAIGRSHRTRNDDDLIAWNKNFAKIELDVESFGVPRKFQFELIRGKTPKLFSNSISIRRSELIGRLKTVLFSPEDLSLIKGSPALRRRFLDIELSQSSPRYYRDLIDYRKIFINRNAVLKQLKDQPMRKDLIDVLDVLDEQFSNVASRIVQKRIEAVKKFSILAQDFQRSISDSQETLSVEYKIHHDVQDVLTWLRKNRQHEIFKGSTRIGPHRDDLHFSINGFDAKIYSSQGQQRTIALAVKLAELEFLKDETYPILLLDDVMSELDSTRRRKLLEYLQTKQIQTMITATDATIFPKDSIDKMFEVESGKIKEPG